LFELISLFVDGAMMTATQHHQVPERRRPTVNPVTDVMALAEPDFAAREAAAAIAVL
jgi:hypothetical protein